MYSFRLQLLALFLLTQFSLHFTQEPLVVGGPTLSGVLTINKTFVVNPTPLNSQPFVIIIIHPNCLSPLLISNGVPVLESWPYFEVYNNSQKNATVLVRLPPASETSTSLLITPSSASCPYNVSAYFSKYSQLNSYLSVSGNISQNAFQFFSFPLSNIDASVIQIKFLPIPECSGIEPYLTEDHSYPNEYYYDSSLKFDFNGYEKVIILLRSSFGSIGFRNTFHEWCTYSLVEYQTPIHTVGGGLGPLDAVVEPQKYQVFTIIAVEGPWYLYIFSADHQLQVSVRELVIPTPFSQNAMQDLTKAGSVLMNVTTRTGIPTYVTVYNVGHVFTVNYKIMISKTPPEPVVPMSPPVLEPTQPNEKLSPGTIVGIVVGCVVFVAIVAVAIWLVFRFGSNNSDRFSRLN